MIFKLKNSNVRASARIRKAPSYSFLFLLLFFVFFSVVTAYFILFYFICFVLFVTIRNQIRLKR